MSTKILVATALDQRDLTAKKINSKIDSLQAMDFVKNNEEKGIKTQKTREEFAEDVKSDFQQIVDLIKRYHALDAALIASNASTMIRTSFGEFSVAEAIAMRSRNRVGTAPCSSNLNFLRRLENKLSASYVEAMNTLDERNSKLEEQAESMRLTILGKDVKTKDDKPLAVIDEYMQQNRTELLDPLGVDVLLRKLLQDREQLLSELETGIKISNATNYIEI